MTTRDADQIFDQLESAAAEAGVKLFDFNARRGETVVDVNGTPHLLSSDPLPTLPANPPGEYRYWDCLTVGIDTGDGSFIPINFTQKTTREELVGKLQAAAKQ
jgi:hypothetical protein